MERNIEEVPTSPDLKRPSSVTIIAWLIIVLAIIGLIVMLVAISAVDRRIVGRLFVVTLIAFPLQMAMGIGMLKGLNWARLLYLWIAPLSLVIGLFGGMLSGGLVFRAVFYVVALFILTRPSALDYFSKTKREFELTRQRAVILSIFAPWLAVAPIVLAGVAFEPSFESPVLRGLMYQWFVIGLAAGIYPAYWYVKDKGYQSGASFLSLGSVFGWIILWSMESKDDPTSSKLFSIPWLPGFAFGFILFFLGMLQPDFVSLRFQYEYGHIVTLLIIVVAAFVAFLISRKQKSLMTDNTIEFKIEKKKFGNIWGFLLGIVAAFVCVMIFEYLRNP